MRFSRFWSFVSPKCQRGIALAALLTLLLACSPRYNWRELTLADGQVRAAFPARVQTESRPVRLGDISTPFTVTAASVDDATFAVGHARLPVDVARDAAHRQKLAHALLESAFVNLGATVPSDLRIDGPAVLVQGQGARQGTWSLVKVWMTADGLVQAIAMGRDGTLPRPIAQEFIDQVVMVP